MENEERYARRCDVTGMGMNEGYVIVDGDMYIASKEDLLIHLRGLDYEDADGNQVNELGLSDSDLMEFFYSEEYYYWTEWYEVDDDFCFTEDGELIETL
jgi:hypothetical protein